MGNTLTAEYPSTWEETAVIKWKETAKYMQKYFYISFNGSHFDEYKELTESQRISKICFAIFGPPDSEKDSIEDAYSDNQRKHAETVLNKIKEVWYKAPEPDLCIGIVFVFCKEQDKEYPVPIFRLLWEKEGSTYESRYIDTACRSYESWNDWKENNHMPMLKYCYPKRGFYSYSDDNSFNFDADKNPVLEFGTSPACDFVARLGRIADTVITTVGITLGVLSLITPAGLFSGPVILSTIGGSAIYNCGRAGQRLYDKASHGESLTDLESIVLIASIIATPLTFISSLVNAKLAAGAVQGRIFSETTRTLATVLFMTTFGFDSFFFIMNIVNLINKAMNDKVTGLDLLQFSLSTLFFTNTLIQPKTAQGIIERAQNQRINSIGSGLTDEQTKVAFENFLKNNEHGDIKSNSKIIRTLNRIDDPNTFFKNTAGKDIKIGGRKGKTVFLTDDGKTTRVNPNEKIIYSQQTQTGVPKIQKLNKLRECLGCDYENHKYLKNMTNRQKGRVSKVFGGAASYNKDVVDVATKLADDFKVKNPDEFMSLVEIVAAEKKSNPNFNLSGNNYTQFNNKLKNDINTATEIAKQKNISFGDPYLATYHYRKHGSEFINNCKIDFYIGKLPNKIINTGKLTEVCNIETIAPDGTKTISVRETYFMPNDEMCVTMTSEGKKKICTIFKNIGGWEKHLNNFPITNSSPNIQYSANDLAVSMGLKQISVAIIDENGTYDATNYHTVKYGADYYQKQIAILLNDLASSNNNNSD